MYVLIERFIRYSYDWEEEEIDFPLYHACGLQNLVHAVACAWHTQHSHKAEQLTVYVELQAHFTRLIRSHRLLLTSQRIDPTDNDTKLAVPVNGHMNKIKQNAKTQTKNPKQKQNKQTKQTTKKPTKQINAPPPPPPSPTN